MGPFALIAARCLKNGTSSRWGDGHAVPQRTRHVVIHGQFQVFIYTWYVLRLVHDNKSDTFRARRHPAFNITTRMPQCWDQTGCDYITNGKT